MWISQNNIVEWIGSVMIFFLIISEYILQLSLCKKGHQGLDVYF